jgi:cysteine desulfurase
MATALQLAVAERDATAKRLRRGRERLVRALTAIGGVEQTGHPSVRLPGLVSIVIRDVEGASVVVKLDLEGVAASVGSACTTGSAEPSHVLRAMGYPDEEARGSLRLSLGRSTTETEIGDAVEIVPLIVGAARSGAQKLDPGRSTSSGARIAPRDNPTVLGSRA